MNKITIILIILIILLLAGNIFLGVEYYSIKVQLQKVAVTSEVNSSILAFDKLFVDKVLKSQGETSYQDRLSLENAVVNTKDSTIIDAWHNFLASTTEADAHARVLVLLDLFAAKLAY